MRWLLLVLLAAAVAAPAAAQQKIKFPLAVIEDAFKKADCSNEAKEAAAKEHEVSGELGSGVFLVVISCSSGAYNFSSLLFSLELELPHEARLLSFRHWEDEYKGFRQTYALTFPSYDKKTKRIRTHHKFRGPGDCGHAGIWHWNGEVFAMQRYWVKNECDGKLFDPEDSPSQFVVFPPKSKKK